MNMKKFISAASALTIAASAFAGMAVTANAAEVALVDTDFGIDVDAELTANDYFSWGNGFLKKSGDLLSGKKDDENPDGVCIKPLETGEEGELLSFTEAQTGVIKYSNSMFVYDMNNSNVSGEIGFYNSDNEKLFALQAKQNGWTVELHLAAGETDLKINQNFNSKKWSNNVEVLINTYEGTATVAGTTVEFKKNSDIKTLKMSSEQTGNLDRMLHIDDLSIKKYTADSIAITGDDTVTVGSGMTGYYTYTATSKDESSGLTWTGGAEWSIDGSAPAGVSIDKTTGVLTIDGSQASTGSVTIKATSGTAAATKTITYTIESYDQVATNVSIEGEDHITYNLEQETFNYTAKAYDQYGMDMMDSIIEWSVTPADQGVTCENGVVTVSKTAEAGVYTVSAKCGNVTSATKSITVKAYQFNEYTPDGTTNTVLSSNVTEATLVNVGDNWTFTPTQASNLTFTADVYVPSTQGKLYFQQNTDRNVGAQIQLEVSETGVLNAKWYAGSGNGQSGNIATDLPTDKYYRITMTAYNVDGNTKANFDFTVQNLTDNTEVSSATPAGVRNLNGDNSYWNKVDINVAEGDDWAVSNVYTYFTNANVNVTANGASVEGVPSYVGQTSNVKITPAEGASIKEVMFGGEAVTANEDGTYTIKAEKVGQELVVTSEESYVAAEYTQPTLKDDTFTSNDGVWAKTFTFTVTPNSDVVTGVTVTPSTGEAKTMNVSLNGKGDVLFGIIAASTVKENLNGVSFTSSITVQ